MTELIIQETNSLFTTINHNGHNYGILSIYRSPNGDTNTFLTQLNNVITNITKKHNRLRLDSNTCLDHVFSNMTNNSPISIQVSLIDSLITYHYPVITQFTETNSHRHSNNTNKETNFYKTINYNTLNRLIKDINWNHNKTDNKSFNLNINILTASLKNLIKQSKITRTNKSIKRNNP